MFLMHFFYSRGQENKVIIVAGNKPWSRDIFYEKIVFYQGEWIFAGTQKELAMLLGQHTPDYVFFLHWSWIVPLDIIEKYECICFHMTDLPFGRGGSPLQNLIIRGEKKTKVTAFRMVGGIDGIDAGPIYLKKELSLEGSAEEIYNRAMQMAAIMIKEIIKEKLIPREQEGEPTYFTRRKPEDSKILGGTINDLYDFIRMLDAPGYPHSYIENNEFLFEFTGAEVKDDSITAQVKITKKKGGSIWGH